MWRRLCIDEAGAKSRFLDRSLRPEERAATTTIAVPSERPISAEP
jgi:hypothetical protein